jgi:hypothetical protein
LFYKVLALVHKGEIEMMEYLNTYNEFWIRYGAYCYQTMFGVFNNFVLPEIGENKMTEIRIQGDCPNEWQTGEMTL